MNQTKRWLLIVAFIALMLGISFCLYIFGGLSLVRLQEYGVYYRQLVQSHYVLSVCIYLISYMMMVMTGVPLFLPLTLMAGYLFGLWWGTLYVVIAANVGAVSSFLLVRYVLCNFLAQRYSDHLEHFKQRINNQGYVYMLAIHLAMVFPYIMINTLAALSGLPLFTFIWTTIIGSFPLIFLYVCAGQQLHFMSSLHNIIPSYVWFVGILVACSIIGLMVIRSRIKHGDDL